jgi:hypothetical protein
MLPAVQSESDQPGTKDQRRNRGIGGFGKPCRETQCSERHGRKRGCTTDYRQHDPGNARGDKRAVFHAYSPLSSSDHYLNDSALQLSATDHVVSDAFVLIKSIFVDANFGPPNTND